MKYLILCLLFLAACANNEKDDPNKWDAELDSFIRDRNGIITFARIHYPLAKTAAMSKARNIKTKKKMRETCAPRQFRITNDKIMGTDFVTLRIDYRRNTQVRVYEFRCQ